MPSSPVVLFVIALSSLLLFGCLGASGPRSETTVWVYSAGGPPAAGVELIVESAPTSDGLLPSGAWSEDERVRTDARGMARVHGRRARMPAQPHGASPGYLTRVVAGGGVFSVGDTLGSQLVLEGSAPLAHLSVTCGATSFDDDASRACAAIARRIALGTRLLGPTVSGPEARRAVIAVAKTEGLVLVADSLPADLEARLAPLLGLSFRSAPGATDCELLVRLNDPRGTALPGFRAEVTQ